MRTRPALEEARRVVAARLRDVPDYPKPGVLFKDITPLLADPAAFAVVIDAMSAPFSGSVDHVVGIEARGFMLAAPIAYRLGAGLIPMRKEGKLPAPTYAGAYELEYGSAVLEVHRDAFDTGHRVLIVDDVLATGGTAAAAASLVEQAGGEVVGVDMLLEIAALGGRMRLEKFDLHCVFTT